MRVLVLDTIHGGLIIKERYEGLGHYVDAVDVYRREAGISLEESKKRDYDLIVSPVHLDPAYRITCPGGRQISHHEAVRDLAEKGNAGPVIEITGSRGKTTTAHALAYLMKGKGVLHSSMGTWEYPEKQLLWRRSVTPASVIPALEEASGISGWCIAEVSLGVTGVGDIAILTSFQDYPIAGGERRAIDAKVSSLKYCPKLVSEAQPEGYVGENICVDDVTLVDGDACAYAFDGIEGVFTNPLLTLSGYMMPLRLAAATAMLLGIDPAPLESFEALSGRMSHEFVDGRLILDNSNSGTNAVTTDEACVYARVISGIEDIVLVIGLEAKNICEGFPVRDVAAAIRTIEPSVIVYVGDENGFNELNDMPGLKGYALIKDDSLENARKTAMELPGGMPVVLSVKTWR